MYYSEYEEDDEICTSAAADLSLHTSATAAGPNRSLHTSAEGPAGRRRLNVTPARLRSKKPFKGMVQHSSFFGTRLAIKRDYTAS